MLLSVLQLVPVLCGHRGMSPNCFEIIVNLCTFALQSTTEQKSQFGSGWGQESQGKRRGPVSADKEKELSPRIPVCFLLGLKGWRTSLYKERSNMFVVHNSMWLFVPYLETVEKCLSLWVGGIFGCV